MLSSLEHRSQPLLSPKLFALRVTRFGMAAAILMAGGLGTGICGYHWICGFTWIDSLLEASMILGGMGPVNPLKTTASKLFASFYALFAGMIFLTSSAIFVAPALHRILHRLHVEKPSRGGRD